MRSSSGWSTMWRRGAMTKQVKGFIQARNWFQSLTPVTME